jgi:hypothetical protein
MFEQVIETSAEPHITIKECLGNLVVKRSKSEHTIVHTRGDGDEVVLTQEGDAITVTADADCFLTCPLDTTLTIHVVMGNLKVDRVAGSITVGDVHGNAKLNDVGPSTLEQTYGNLYVRQVEGDLDVQTVRGNAKIYQVEGSLSLGQTYGNLIAEGIEGNLEVNQVRGNSNLGPLFSPGTTHRLDTRGNLKVNIPVDASLRLTLRADGDVRSRVPGLSLEEVDGEMQGMLGFGEATLEAEAGGRISLRSSETYDFPTTDLPFTFSELEGLAHIEEQIAEATADLESRLEESLGRIDGERIRLQVTRATERARRQAERSAEKARLRAERAERRWQRASGKRSRAESEPASDEERMRVLRMVEDGKISPEQAADLLAALEGR